MTVHYLDHAASTPVRPVAIEVMTSALRDCYGNPSGAHRLARSANMALDEAREAMGAALGCEPGQVVFTGGGTEADNMAVVGVAQATSGSNRSQILCSAIEHHAVLDPVENHGGQTIAVNANGRLDLAHLEELLVEAGDQIALVSVMLANNETGIVQPLGEVVELVRQHAYHALIHTDAVQALTWLDVAERCAEVDLISVSAHKFGGPKGVGALVVRNRAKLEPLTRGGGQERGRRGGTQNVAGIAAMASAATETVAQRSATVARVSALRDRLADGIRSELVDVVRVVESGVTDFGAGARTDKTANICHLCFEGVESEALLFLLEKDGLMASAASSCSSGAQEPSHVLAAMGFDRNLAQGSLRLSLGSSSTAADVDIALEAVPSAVRRLVESGS